MADAGLFAKYVDGFGHDVAVNDLKALANQGVFPVDIYQGKEGHDYKSTDKKLSEHDTQVQMKSAGSGPSSPGYTAKSGPHSPSATASGGVSPNSAAVVGRKRRSRDEVEEDIPGESNGTRKSLRGAGVKSTRGKRPKMVVANN